MKPLIIGTRGSPLALWQAEWVGSLLAEKGIETRIERVRTSGDKHRKGPLATKGGKGLFIKELENALLEETVDLAVHSLKDVPTELDESFALAAFLPRADPRDCFVAREGISHPRDLPNDALVGSCSPRRISQVLHMNPSLRIQDLRGNVGTRLEKVRNGTLDATFLAKAGLDRLEMTEDPLLHPLEIQTIVPAAGQGIVAIEIVAERKELSEILGQLNDPSTEAAALAERSVVRHLGGTCVSPIGAFARIDGERMYLTACVGDSSGRRVLRESEEGITKEASQVGEGLAARLNELGAQEILPKIE